MVGVRRRGEEIRRFVLENVTEHPRDIVARTMARFDITREAALQHVRKLIAQKAIIAEGKTRNRTYQLHPSTPWSHTYALDGLQEDLVYDQGVGKQLADLPDNVRNAWAHGITEMVNNAIDHSEGRTVRVELTRTATDCRVTISDDGIGIFQKVIPIKLGKQGDFLVSRSQAKRLLLRAESFRTVVFDFEGVDSIGQAFADEVFRVFHRRHPEVNLKVINANQSVQRMISRAEVTNPSK